jgi:alanyl-tRNA synthetase
LTSRCNSSTGSTTALSVLNWPTTAWAFSWLSQNPGVDIRLLSSSNWFFLPGKSKPVPDLLDPSLQIIDQCLEFRYFHGIAAAQFGLETVGVHIGLEGCTVDFDKKVEWDIAAELERRALGVVTLDIPVETTFHEQQMPGESGGGEELCRGRPARDSKAGRLRHSEGMPLPQAVIRIVKIGEVDTSACCGAHLPSTGRIGVIRIFDLETRKQGMRVSFLAGARALERSQVETAVLRELRKLAGCATADLPALFHKGQERVKELGKELERIWSLRLADLAKAAETVPVGASTVSVYVGELPRELASVLAGMMAEATNGAGVVVSDINIALSSRTLDAGGLLKKIQNAIGGKGGGSPKSANGRLDRPVTADELGNILRSQ